MQHSKAISLFTLAMILGAVIAGSASVSAQVNGFLSVQGTWIVDSTGKAILLRGVNCPGYDSQYPRLHTEAAYANFAKMGFNVVRLQISWVNLEGYKGRFYDYFLSWYVDRDVQWAKKYGLYIVLDMHQYQWARKFGGSGAPDWSVGQYPGNEPGMRQAVSDFWADPSIQDHLVMVWKNIATHYAKEPTIAGYDLFNEPWVYTSLIPQLNATHIDSFYTRVTEAIRSVDPYHLIFLEPANMNTFNTSFDGKIVWAPHFYPWSFAQEYYPQNLTILEADLEAKYQTFVLNSKVPMWIGEFGAYMKDHSAERWLEDAKTLFDKFQVGWAWWAYGDGSSIPDCLKNPGTNTNQVLLFIPTVISHPYDWFQMRSFDKWIF
jgi:aryl-phospho-beta-D-glucosidase BglC (GH1 family)